MCEITDLHFRLKQLELLESLISIVVFLTKQSDRLISFSQPAYHLAVQHNVMFIM